MPNAVRVIKREALYNFCMGSTAVTLSNGLDKKIGAKAFYNCRSIEERPSCPTPSG